MKQSPCIRENDDEVRDKDTKTEQNSLVLNNQARAGPCKQN